MDQNGWMSAVEDVLRELNVGKRVAEDETDDLADYFVETDQFRRIMDGDVDIVFGAKGAGKSAIYASILGRASDLFDRGITLVPGEIPRGNPAFAAIVADPPTSEHEFVGLWKIYVLSLVDSILESYDVRGDDAGLVRGALTEAGLAPEPTGLRGLVQRVRAYVGRLEAMQAVEGGLKLDPATGLPVGLTGKIILGEPTPQMREAGYHSADDLLYVADRALGQHGVQLWVIFDRLDVAFQESVALEANALRALFRVYLDNLGLENIRLKIFLRTDIWRAVTAEGFREASHVTRVVTIDWSPRSLLNLVVRRLLNNPLLLDFTGADSESVRDDAVEQRRWFDSLVPEQIDSGRNPRTFEWILGRVTDGNGDLAPREVIHVLDQAREQQLSALERGEESPGEGALFSRGAFRDALPEVSRTRLEQTIFAEYPDLKGPLEKLEGEKTNQTLESLASLWDMSDDEAADIAARAVDVGFFSKQGSKESPEFWVPFLYRPALEMVQGTAD